MNNKTREQKKLVSHILNELSHTEQLYVVKIIVDSGVKYNTNANGVLVNMKLLDQETYNNLSGFVKHCIDNKTRTIQLDEERIAAKKELATDILYRQTIQRSTVDIVNETRKEHFNKVIDHYCNPHINTKNIDIDKNTRTRRDPLLNKLLPKNPAKKLKAKTEEGESESDEFIDVDIDIDDEGININIEPVDMDNIDDLDDNDDEDEDEGDEKNEIYNELSMRYEESFTIEDNSKRKKILNKIMFDLKNMFPQYENDTDFKQLYDDILESKDEC